MSDKWARMGCRQPITSNLRHWNSIVCEIANTEHTLHGAAGPGSFVRNFFSIVVAFFVRRWGKNEHSVQASAEQSTELHRTIIIILWFDLDFRKIEQIKWQWLIWNIIRRSAPFYGMILFWGWSDFVSVRGIGMWRNANNGNSSNAQPHSSEMSA